jgi:hypothetical protein
MVLSIFITDPSTTSSEILPALQPSVYSLPPFAQKYLNALFSVTIILLNATPFAEMVCCCSLHSVHANFLCIIELFTLAPGIRSSSALLSWPQGSEFVDSHLQLFSFWSTSCWFSYNGPHAAERWEEIPVSSWRGLGGVDYRKCLTANIILDRTGLFGSVGILGWPVIQKVVEEALFRSLKSKYFKKFKPEPFLRVRFFDSSAS